MDLYLVWMIHSTHSPEIRSFWLMKLSNEMLQYILTKIESFKNLVAHYKLHWVALSFYRCKCSTYTIVSKRKGRVEKAIEIVVLVSFWIVMKRERKNCSKMKTQRGPYKIILCISLQHLLVVNGSKLVIVVKFVWTFWIIWL